MGELLDLAFYNPARLHDEDFLRGFVAREDLVQKVLGKLREIRPKGRARHRLVIGQRGMGKTSLLRRIAIGVREDPDLSGTLLPLGFREEQYNVHNLHVLWCNCLDALGDWFEGTGQHDKAAQVDRDVAALCPRRDDADGEAALEAFRGWMHREERRPLLLLDNIDLILKGLKEQQWDLRRALQEAGGIVVIGASSAYLEAAGDPKEAFYEFFQVDVLRPLTHEELLSSLRALADQRGEKGVRVLRALDRDPARIRTLHDLTGGNPRTLLILYLMLEMGNDRELMRDLEWILDQVTPLYKARVEELAAQARVVFDATALHWNPVIAADIAAATGLEVNAVSAHTTRLVNDGLLEKVAVSSSNRTAYQVAERFFNVWYLMRHAPRRQRNRLRWLTEFLRGFYTQRQLRDIADSYLRRPSVDGHLLLGESEMDGAADALYRQAVSRLPETGAVLLEAFHALAHDNIGTATRKLGEVLDRGGSDLFSNFYEDLLRLLRLAKSRGHGDRLLTWFEESGLGERYWPLQAAFDAYVHGEERLRDVNPEVRGAAQRIFDWLVSRPAQGK
ncbi:MAG: ATP-binding protein [Deltaproteobacteria bacterium]|nr:ATP-binding protein [Deltaproteobacteria bacterium]